MAWKVDEAQMVPPGPVVVVVVVLERCARSEAARMSGIPESIRGRRRRMVWKVERAVTVCDVEGSHSGQK